MSWGLAWELFRVFFTVSLFSLGGGYNMIPLMQREVVARGWAGEAEFMEIVALSEATPGPVAVNMATYAGMRAGGVAGAATATAGVVLPGGLLVLAFGAVLRRWRGQAGYRAAMRGAMAAVAVLLARTAWGALKGAMAGGGGGWVQIAVVCGAAGVLAVAFRRGWIGAGAGLLAAGVLGGLVSN